MSIAALYNKLMKQGYNVERITVYNVNGSGKDAEGIIARHDYSGLYPTRDALETHAAISNIARRAGFAADKRGHYTATLIYKAVTA